MMDREVIAFKRWYEGRTKHKEWQSVKRKREEKKAEQYFFSAKKARCTGHVKFASVSPGLLHPRFLLYNRHCYGALAVVSIKFYISYLAARRLPSTTNSSRAVDGSTGAACLLSATAGLPACRSVVLQPPLVFELAPSLPSSLIFLEPFNLPIPPNQK